MREQKTNPLSPAFFKDLLIQIRLMLRLMAEPRVTLWAKAVPILTLVYLISPLDFLLGPIDDMVVVYFGMDTFISLCPKDIVSEHLNALKGIPRQPDEAKVIEGKFRNK